MFSRLCCEGSPSLNQVLDFLNQARKLAKLKTVELFDPVLAQMHRLKVWNARSY